jgi:hypothetical protein
MSSYSGYRIQADNRPKCYLCEHYLHDTVLPISIRASLLYISYNMHSLDTSDIIDRYIGIRILAQSEAQAESKGGKSRQQNVRGLGVSHAPQGRVF